MKSREVILVDDDKRTRSDIANKISDLIEYEVRAIDAPKLDDTNEILEKKPLLIIIDFLLNMKREDGTVASYQGGTLLNRLLEDTQDIPLVIITRSDIYPSHPNLRQLAEIADLVFLKSQLDKPKFRIDRKLKALINGYHKIGLKFEERSWDSLLELLSATSAESNLLDETNPPIGPDDSVRLGETDLAFDEIQDKGKIIGWTAHDASKWIIGKVFSFPGILYDYRYSAVSLGIDPESFLIEKGVQKFFDKAKYYGIFKEYDDFWWRGRLRNIAIASVGLKESKPLQEIFPSWFESKTKIELQRAKCNSSGEVADTICFILNEPVKTDYSLLYYPDNRPSIMDLARISFKAIRTSNRVKRHLVKKTDAVLFDEIREGKLDDILTEVK